MNPGNYTIRIEPGNTYSRTLRLSQGGDPYDLTGYTAVMRFYDSDGDLVSITPGITITDEEGGVINFQLDLVDTAALENIEDGRYELKVTAAGNSVVMTILKGRLTSNRWSNG
jgi:hypothetical protein